MGSRAHSYSFDHMIRLAEVSSNDFKAYRPRGKTLSMMRYLLAPMIFSSYRTREIVVQIDFHRRLFRFCTAIVDDVITIRLFLGVAIN